MWSIRFFFWSSRISSLKILSLIWLFSMGHLLIFQKSGEGGRGAGTALQCASKAGKVRASSGFDGIFKGFRHVRDISRSGDSCVCHDSRSTHFHGFARLRGFSYSASTMIGRSISSIRIWMNSFVHRPLFVPMGAARGITVAAPALSRSLAVFRSGYI